MGVEEALAFLHKKSTTNGDSVFAHLSHVIQQVLETKADNAVDILETSILLKQTRLLLEERGALNLQGRTPDEDRFVQTFLELYNVATKPPPDPDAEEYVQGEATDGETNAEEEISAYPPFPGVEKNYLRAQIARISATTILALKGYYVAEEPEEGEEPSGNVERNEEWTMLPPDELGKLEAWVHQNPHIKKQGRCFLHVPELETHEESEEEAEEETPKAEEEPEQSPEILSSVENDEEMSNGLKPWSISFSSSIKGLKHQIVCLRSFLWPGAYTVATKHGFSNVYVGWGVKNSPFQPPLPPEVQKEYAGELVESLELPPIPEPEVQEEPTESEAEHDVEEEE